MNKYYYKDGVSISTERDRGRILHRENGPAVEYADGDKAWWFNGKKHRVGGPAIITGPGSGCSAGLHLSLENFFIEGIYYYIFDYVKIMKEVEEMPLELRLTDPREWVRRWT